MAQASSKVAWQSLAFLAVAAILLFLAGVQLYVFSTHTDQFFAWTINPPLTAAFLGAGYWAALPATILNFRDRHWSRLRAAIPPSLISVPLLSLTTFLHIDRFHFGPDFAGLPKLAAWVWLVVYIVAPLGLLASVIIQWRRGFDDDLQRTETLPAVLRYLLLMQGLIGVVSALILYLAPQTAITLWPWQLSVLTSRTLTSWMAAVGAAGFMMFWQNDRDWNRYAGVAFAVFGALQLIAVLRFGDALIPGIGSILYLAYMLTVLIAGVWSMVITPPLTSS